MQMIPTTFLRSVFIERLRNGALEVQHRKNW
jgi:hypothetical protein